MLMDGMQRVIQLMNLLWRMYEMYKRSMTMTKGVCIGVLAGAAATAIGTQMMKDKKHLKKNANKALHAIGDFVGNMETMFKG